MADENENSAASGKFIFKLQLTGDENCVDNAIKFVKHKHQYIKFACAAVRRFRNAHITSKNFQNFYIASERKHNLGRVLGFTFVSNSTLFILVFGQLNDTFDVGANQQMKFVRVYVTYVVEHELAYLLAQANMVEIL